MVRRLHNAIEVLHGGHVAWQEQFSIIPMGQNVHSNAKHFYCSCHATWPPCKIKSLWLNVLLNEHFLDFHKLNLYLSN